MLKHTGMAAVMMILLGPGIVAHAHADDGGHEDERSRKPVKIEMFAPEEGYHVGIGGRGWFIDLALEFDAPLNKTGFSAFQLTGPGVHNNAPPMPGTFSLGADDRLPGLIVLLSTTTVGARSCQNIANLFNLTGVTDSTPEQTELWSTWIVGAPSFGVDTQSTVLAAVAKDLNHDGVYNDAPNVVPDANHDGQCDAKDLKALGMASKIEQVQFFINP